MANGEYLRGEIYWVSFDDNIGGEPGTGRPGLIVSGDHWNGVNDTVTIAWITTKIPDRSSPIHPTFMLGTERRRVLCDQLRTVDKRRLDKLVHKLGTADMIRVSGALAVCMCIPNTSPKQPAEQESETENLKMQVTMYQKLYEKTMDQLVEMKIANDLNRKISKSEKEPAEENTPDPPSAPTPEPENPKVEINTCTVEDLIACGCNIALARLIVSYRPYKTVADLMRVPGLKSAAFQILKHKVCCIQSKETTKPKMIVETPKEEVETGKVNVNTIPSARQLRERTGMALRSANGIMRYRKEHGNFATLDDLLKVPEFGATCMKRYRDKLEV